MTQFSLSPKLTELFWSKVDKSGPGGCWLWTQKTMLGYGAAYTGQHGRQDRAHRVAWMLSGRSLPRHKYGGLVLDHICRVRHCVNPDHLRLVLQRQNCLHNSESIPARNARKTHCKRGHEFSGDNVARLITPGLSGLYIARVCLTCYPSKRNAPTRVDRGVDFILEAP
jgi:hypothetical protein